MNAKLQQALYLQRVSADKIAKALNLSFLPVANKKAFGGYLLGKDRIIPMEVKVRNFAYGTFETTLVEKDLIQKLRNSVAKNQFTTCYYAEVFTDGVAIVFDLASLPLEWTREDCNVETIASTKKKKAKSVAFVSYELGNEIVLNGDPAEKQRVKTTDSKILF